MTAEEIDRVTEALVLPSSHRSWVAHGVAPEGPLGFSLGVETAFVLRRDVGGLGDANAVAPKTIPVPRFWLGAEFPMDLKLSASFGLSGLFDGIQTYGIGGHWSFFRSEDRLTNFSVDLRYTYTNVFDDLKANVLGLSVQASKDLILWQPYAGAGFLVANSTAVAEVMASGEELGPHTKTTYHVYVGARIDLLAKLSIQLDVMGAKPSLGILLEKDF